MAVSDPTQSVLIQIRKLGQALKSGEYSVQKWTTPIETEPGVLTDAEEYQDSIKPYMFKNIIGQGDREFSGGRQQDAFEYVHHLLQKVERAETTAGTQASFPGKMFNFTQVTRLQCANCGGVIYRETLANCIPNLNIPFDYSTDSDETQVSWDTCVNSFGGVEMVDLNCGRCGSTQQFSKVNRFGTFPKVLMVQMERFVCPDWVPTKLKCNVGVPLEQFTLDQFAATRVEGEDLLPDEADNKNEPEFDMNAISMITSGGFTSDQAKWALFNTGMSGAEAAYEWLIMNIENPDIHKPFEVPSPGKASAENIAMLTMMGLTDDQAKRALNKCDNDAERALDWYFSHPEEANAPEEAEAAPPQVETGPPNYKLTAFVTHLGASPLSGHYVTHIEKNGEWVLYNDNKVAASTDPPCGKAYIYFFSQVQ